MPVSVQQVKAAGSGREGALNKMLATLEKRAKKPLSLA
jgi:hypothetical protein